MALVQYSDSESETENESPQRPAKRPRQAASNQSSSLPPLPAAFHDLYASSTRVSVTDDPSLHGGRKRVIPHVEGNWPTHIYLEWYPSKDELSILSDVIAQINNRLDGSTIQLHSLLHSDLGAQLPLHISLSRPVVLRTEQRQSFLEAFQAQLKELQIPTFNVTTNSLDCVSNYEKTRWFYVLRAEKPEEDNLNRLLWLSNRALARFEQPPLYESTQDVAAVRKSKGGGTTVSRVSRESGQTGADYSHCFHISLAWSLTDLSSAERERIRGVDLRKVRELSVRFDCVKVKIGNQVSSIPLQ
ncbi:poly(U)-specific 3'-to-5' RNA exonuclease [Aspergillus brasiliensis]|uniref:U6 snRNA phosphodiesterase n=1 Tax=Aspergillus brasiliensis TaxID=319629 RepID=A0A9W5YZL9_9EURO|nr:poly(U)-specific 3'-to-5' RNA exonuclease [Aspergillus brasiliensis]GKZ44777.1 poly(U)-specific 3'-to-5' RNA exonuclease [Aspergillus brasiliensis]